FQYCLPNTFWLVAYDLQHWGGGAVCTLEGSRHTQVGRSRSIGGPTGGRRRFERLKKQRKKKEDTMTQAISIKREGSIATVIIDRGQKRNALSQDMVLELTRIAQEFHDDTDTQCVVLTGNDTEFSAGIDLSDPDRWNL